MLCYSLSSVRTFHVINNVTPATMCLQQHLAAVCHCYFVSGQCIYSLSTLLPEKIIEPLHDYKSHYVTKG